MKERKKKAMDILKEKKRSKKIFEGDEMRTCLFCVDIIFQQRAISKSKAEYKRTQKVNCAQKEHLVVVFYLNSQLS